MTRSPRTPELGEAARRAAVNEGTPSTHFAENEGLDVVAHQPPESFVELADFAVELALCDLVSRVWQTEAANSISETVGDLVVGAMEGVDVPEQVEVSRRVSAGMRICKGHRRSRSRKQRFPQTKAPSYRGVPKHNTLFSTYYKYDVLCPT